MKSTENVKNYEPDSNFRKISFPYPDISMQKDLPEIGNPISSTLLLIVGVWNMRTIFDWGSSTSPFLLVSFGTCSLPLLQTPNLNGTVQKVSSESCILF